MRKKIQKPPKGTKVPMKALNWHFKKNLSHWSSLLKRFVCDFKHPSMQVYIFIVCLDVKIKSTTMWWLGGGNKINISCQHVDFGCLQSELTCSMDILTLRLKNEDNLPLLLWFCRPGRLTIQQIILNDYYLNILPISCSYI